MKLLIFLALLNYVFAQDSRENAVNSIFSNDFLNDYEEVTQPPLKSFGALSKCGEAEQLNRFVCVPYYNCDPNTSTVIENAEVDGTNKIDVRLGDSDPKCDHYLEVCCQLPNGTNVTTNRPTTPVTSGPDDRDNSRNSSPTPPVTDSSSPRPTRVNCGIRNTQGLDFNLVGSTNEAKFGEFPWMVAVLRKNPRRGEQLSICGGSLIGPRVILTGAHCVQNVSINDIKVRAGEWDTQTQNERIPHQERNVAQKILNEHFIRGNLYNDVALLILDRPFTKTDSVGTVCLPEDSVHFNSRDCFATGWGKNIFGQEGQYAVILKKIQVPLVHNKNCEKSLQRTRLGASFILHRSFICAGGEPNIDTCTGDGGSPLVCPDPNNPGRYLQVGIVAWGIGCGENQVPGVYADVANFRTWIDLKLQALGIRTDSYTK